MLAFCTICILHILRTKFLLGLLKPFLGNVSEPCGLIQPLQDNKVPVCIFPPNVSESWGLIRPWMDYKLFCVRSGKACTGYIVFKDINSSVMWKVRQVHYGDGGERVNNKSKITAFKSFWVRNHDQSVFTMDCMCKNINISLKSSLVDSKLERFLQAR